MSGALRHREEYGHPAQDLDNRVYPLFTGHAHLTDFNIATIIKDGERATALAGTKPYMGKPKASGDTWPCRAMPLLPQSDIKS